MAIIDCGIDVSPFLGLKYGGKITVVLGIASSVACTISKKLYIITCLQTSENNYFYGKAGKMVSFYKH
jgi:hypothetical protein